MCGICTERGEDPIDRMGLSDDAFGVVAALLERVALHGPQSLPDNRNHAVNASPKILQLTPGSNLARLLYFFDEGKCVILCDAFEKPGGKSQQTPRAVVKRAVGVYNEYFEQKRKSLIEWIE